MRWKKWWCLALAAVMMVSLLSGCAANSGPVSSEDSLGALLRQGDENLKNNNYGNAMEAYEKALDLDPENDKAYIGLAQVYEEMGNMESARDILKTGYKETRSSRIKRRLEKMEESSAPASTSVGSIAQASSSEPAEGSSALSLAEKTRQELPADVVSPDVYLDYPAHALTTVQLHLRKGPSQEYESILKMDPNGDVEEVGYLNSTGDWVLVLYRGVYGWCASEYLAYSGGMAKPVIYLYPQEDMDVQVQVDFANGGFTCTYPAYDQGWHVRAKPDGTLVNQADGREYSYLYWEGESSIAWDMSQGFCVPRDETAAFLQDKLAVLGLTPREYNEFIVYWLPLLEENPYNLITFQQAAYTDNIHLQVTPEPDSLLRVYMVYQPLQAPIEVPAQPLSGFVRQGFTVVEWGGGRAA